MSAIQMSVCVISSHFHKSIITKCDLVICVMILYIYFGLLKVVKPNILYRNQK